MKKRKEAISIMFLVSKRIYFATRETIGDEDKVNMLNQLNNYRDYIEKALQFRQQKSFKSQPEAPKKTVSTSADTSDLNTSSMNNNKQTALAQGKSFPGQIEEEPAQDGVTLVPPSPASPNDGHDFIFPSVNQPGQEIGKRQQEITEGHLCQEIGPENSLDFAR